MNHIMPKAVALALACALTLPLAAWSGPQAWVSWSALQ